MSAADISAFALAGLAIIIMAITCLFILVTGKEQPMPEGAQLLEIHLHQPPISTLEVRELIKAQPQFYPLGGKCAHCRREPPWLFEMYPVELIYEIEPHVSVSRYVYCCTAAHAAQYILSWWEPPPGALAVDIPKGQNR